MYHSFKCQVIDRSNGAESVRVVTAESAKHAGDLLNEQGFLVGTVTQIVPRLKDLPLPKKPRKPDSLFSRAFWRFEVFATPQLIVAMFILVASLFALGILVDFAYLITQNAIQAALRAFVGAVASVVLLLVLRISLEFVMVVFHIAKRLDQLVELQSKQPGEAAGPQS